MKVNPTGPRPNDPAQVETNRAAEARQDERAKGPANKQKNQVKADSVEVSSEARALAKHDAPATNSGIHPDRLKEIGERLASGFYEQPEVVDEVARRLEADPDFNKGKS